MSARAEQETQILFNRADADDGYFTVGTSIKSHYEKIVRRVGRKNVISVSASKTKQGREVYWDIKLPLSHLSLTNFGIRKPLSQRAQEAKRLSGQRLARGKRNG